MPTFKTQPSADQFYSNKYSKQSYSTHGAQYNPMQQVHGGLSRENNGLQSLLKKTSELKKSASQYEATMQAVAQNQTGGSSSAKNITQQQTRPASRSDSSSQSSETHQQLINNRQKEVIAKTQELQQNVDGVTNKGMAMAPLTEKAGALNAIAKKGHFKKSKPTVVHFKEPAPKKGNGLLNWVVDKGNGLLNWAANGLRSLGSLFSRGFQFLGKPFSWFSGNCA